MIDLIVKNEIPRKSRYEVLKDKYIDYAELLSQSNLAELDMNVTKAKYNILQDISLTLAKIYDEMRDVKHDS